MNTNSTAAEKEMAETNFNAVSEYKIGHTTYIVKTRFNPAFQESLSDVLKRIIIRESEKIIGANRRETEKQAV